MRSYTHAVFVSKNKEVSKFYLHDVSYAILQIREMCSDEDGLVLLLWILGSFRKNRPKDYFSNSAKQDMAQSLVESNILVKKGDYFELDEAFSAVLREAERQNNLYVRAFRMIQNSRNNTKDALVEDSEENSNTMYEEFSKNLAFELDLWDEANNIYSNPDNVPDKVLKVRLEKATYEYLKTLKWNK